ncbi:MAG: DUF1616 domain-containing protein [Candidatus Bathyarchaeia archaeon]
MNHKGSSHVRPQDRSLDEVALAYLRKNGSASVKQLHDALKVTRRSLTEAEATDLVWRLVGRGEADVEDIPPATKSVREYLRLWERNLPLYLSLTVSLGTLLVVYALPDDFPLVVFRWVLGSVFVLFIPGYVAVEALFPKGRELDGIERLALSVGLSLALVPLVGLLLNYTPWGIRLDPIMISLTILTIGLALVAFARRFRLSVERFELRELS